MGFEALTSIQGGTMHWTPPVAAAVLVGLRSRRLPPLVGDESAAQLRVLLRLLRQGWSVSQPAERSTSITRPSNSS